MSTCPGAVRSPCHTRTGSGSASCRAHRIPRDATLRDVSRARQSCRLFPQGPGQPAGLLPGSPTVQEPHYV